MAAPVIRAATPVYKYVLASVTVVGVFAIGTGMYLVFAGDSGNSTIHAFGQDIETGSVGVACVFLGIVVVGFGVRAILQSVNGIVKRIPR